METKVNWEGMSLQGGARAPARARFVCQTSSKPSYQTLASRRWTIQRKKLPSLKAVQDSTQAASLEAPPEKPVLAGGGGGIFFFWQLGALEYLMEHYDLKSIQFVGASAGALVTTLGACGVSPDVAIDSAYRLSVEEKLWDKKLGLLGIWGGLVRRWLDEILPHDAHDICRGRLKLVVTDVLRRRQVYLEDFSDKKDLIDANMASVHIPVFLDFGPFSFYKRRPYVDGSLSDFLFWQNGKLLTLEGRSFVLDYSKDTELEYSRLDFVKLRSYESVMQLKAQGRRYAAAVDAEGGFHQFFGSVKMTPKGL